MKFILVQIADEIGWGIPKWRATSIAFGKTVDIFFFSPSIIEAKDHIRKRYPAAVFTDGD